MPSRGPYYCSKDAWVAQLVGGTTGYGNGAGTLIHVGPVPNATSGDPDFKSRGMFEISAADVTAMMADATVMNSVIISMVVGANTCMGSRGGTIRILLEEMTTSFSANSKTGCSLSSTSSADSRWDQSSNVTVANRAFYSGSPSGGDTLSFDVTAIFAARLAAGNITSAFRFRIIAANTDGSGYSETTTSRRLSVCSTEDGTAANRPQMTATITTGNIAKTMTDTGHGTETFSVTQTGTTPQLDEFGVGVDAFTAGPVGTWTTVLDSNNNGRAQLYVPSRNVDNFAILPSVSQEDIQLRCKVSLDKVPLGGSGTFLLLARVIDRNNCYRARITMGGSLHDISIVLEKIVGGVVTTLQFITNIRTFLAATDFWLKMQVETTDIGVTTLNAKTWRWGDAEPGWTLNVQDSEPALQIAGAIGMGGRLSSTVTNAPITFTMDQLEGFAP